MRCVNNSGKELENVCGCYLCMESNLIYIDGSKRAFEQMEMDSLR